MSKIKDFYYKHKNPISWILSTIIFLGIIAFLISLIYIIIKYGFITFYIIVLIVLGLLAIFATISLIHDILFSKRRRNKKYKVYYSGFTYVEADSEEEAKDIVLDDNRSILYSEYRVDNVEEVDEFIVDWDN